MLKLHHLNLMNEIQETALMLNLYEQKQLIRQQQEQMRQIQELQLLEEASSRKEQNIFSQNKQERTNATFDDCRQSKRSKSS